MSNLFLTGEEIAELTGVLRGTNGKSREERQADALRKMGVPHYVNEIKRPMVARATIEGGGQAMAQAAKVQAGSTWEPSVR